MTDRASHDSVLTTAFSLYSNPGAYALVLGAGVSAPSGIPTAWGVLTELVERLAMISSDVTPTPTGDAAHAWYQERLGKFATYEHVLEQIAPQPHERQRVLRDFFERSADDVAAERKLPTLAHRSIARLVRAGAVKLVVTLNFDRLMEQALRDEGLEPTVISTPADVLGMAPLHTLDCCVIHLHGDYLNPTSMRNTEDELQDYGPPIAELLRRIVGDYGLILAGWSSQYDPALRGAIAEHYPSRYTLTWIEPGVVVDAARDLRALKKGSLLPLDADTSFGLLADAVEALSAREARHPLSVAVAVESAKRELSGRTVAIGVHDTLRTALSELSGRPELHLDNWYDTAHYPEYLGKVEEATRLPAALVASLAYWGTTTTDRWWLSEFERFATPEGGGGATMLLKLRMVPGAVLFYAAGVAAVAAQRFDLLSRMFVSRRLNVSRMEHEPLALALDPAEVYEGVHDREHRHFRFLAPILAEALTVGDDVVEEAWQLFEVLRLTAAASVASGSSSGFHTAASDFAAIDAQFQTSKATHGPTGERALREQREAALRQGARFVPLDGPHVRVTNFRGFDGFRSPIALHLLAALDADPHHPLVKSGFTSSVDNFAFALEATSTALGGLGERLARQWSGPGGVPMDLWGDTGAPIAR